MKHQLREQLLAKRNQLSEQEIAKKSECILQRLIPYLQHAHCIGVYKSIASEVKTDSIIRYLFEHDLRIAVPKCEKNGIMQFYVIDERTQFEKNAMGIEEPINAEMVKKSDIDLMLVPMVGYCHHMRLGYGGGYYDRYLADCSAYKIGLAFACQQAEFTSETYDIPMDIIILEDQTI